MEIEDYLQKLDEAIAAEYRRFAQVRPGVTLREAGRLGDLWREFDYWIEELND